MYVYIYDNMNDSYDTNVSYGACFWSTSSQVETGFLLDLPLKWISGWPEVGELCEIDLQWETWDHKTGEDMKMIWRW